MQNINQSPFYNQPFVINNNNFQIQTPQPNMISLLLNLQKSMSKQQMAIQLLLQQQQQQQKTQYMGQLQQGFYRAPVFDTQMQQNTLYQNIQKANFLINESSFNHLENDVLAIKKEEDNSFQMAYREPSVITADSSQDFSCKNEPISEFSESIEGTEAEEDSYIKQRPFKIIRRNGFKGKKNQEVKLKTKEKTFQKIKRKSNKHIMPKRPPSKAKHLWINYGRKIIEFALSQTSDDGRTRIKQLVGKLGSRKDFEEVFGIKYTDSECDRTFKVLFGEIALFFIRYKADEAFKDSNYKDKMIAQKHIVSMLIKNLIYC